MLVLVLHALSRLETFAVDWADLSGWLSDSPFEDVFGAVVLLVAVGLAYWLLLSTVAYLLASFSGRPALVGAVRWLTLPPIRRLVSRAVALSLAASAVAGSLAPAVAHLAGGDRASEVIVEVDSQRLLHPPGAETAIDSGDESIGAPAKDESPDIVVPPHLRPVPAADSAGETPPLPAPLDGSVVHQVKVRRGDHLWGLSEQHLQRVLIRASLGEHEIAGYWVQVIAANRDAIRSGDPDLIYPGEVITLPVVELEQ